MPRSAQDDRKRQQGFLSTRSRRLYASIWLAFALCFSLAALTASAQTDAPAKTAPEDLSAKSLPLRTALYHDPTLAAPLDRLLQVYREPNRTKELLDLYRAHLAQYPADTGSQIVLLRLLLAAGEPEADPRIRAAAGQFPDVGYLQFLLYQQLQSGYLAEALAALDRAIDKETLPARKRAWTELLIPQAMTAGRADLAEKHLRAWATRAATSDEKLEAARAMITQRFFPLALEALTAADAVSPSAETGVEIQLTAATAEIGLNQGDTAGLRLDKLLARLTADYWRRAEIVRRRAALVKSDSQRAGMLQTARKRVADAPHDEAAALDLAQLLESFEQRREALTTLLAAGSQVPGSEKIERATLDLCDRLRDERAREEYLSARLRAQPGRQDLAALRVRTFFLLGRHGEALAALDTLAGPMDPAGRINYLLELARALRRSSLPSDAAEVFERVVKLAPDRYEVRRELAETYLVVGKKDKARALFAAGPPADVPAENLGDVIGFMSKQGLLVEARNALAGRLSADPTNFELRLLALDLAGKLGDQAAGETLLTETRPLADTAARYRRWLEAGGAFAEIFEAKAAFFQAEAARLTPTQTWTRDTLEHHLAFIDVAVNNDRKDDAQLLLRADLDAPSPPEMRIEFRRKLVGLLATDAAQAAALQEQLAALTKDDPAHADEYRVRQALAFQRAQRLDQAMETLGLRSNKLLGETLDVGKIGDPALLFGLESLLAEGGDHALDKSSILRRLIEIDPTNRTAWERWITAQAINGEEAGLRQTLRRLLAGIDRMPVSPETREVLQQQLAASCWRSIHTLLNEDNPTDVTLSDALVTLDAAEGASGTRADSLWVNWTRAYLLNRLGRRDARDQAVAELARLSAERPPALPTQPAAGQGLEEPVAGASGSPVSPPAGPDARRIIFPDGVAIALSDARELLTANPSPGSPAWRASRTGPVGALRARWAFDTDRRSVVVQILPLEGGCTLVADQAGQNYCLEAKTGKLLWTYQGAASQAKPPENNGNVYYGNWTQQVSFPKAAVDGAGRLLLPLADRIECVSVAEGKLLWRAEISKSPAGGQVVFPAVFSTAGKVIACNPASGQVCAFDPSSGKLLWDRPASPPAKTAAAPLHALNSGASLSGRKLLLYGANAAVLDVETGRPEWIFAPEAVQELPLALKESDAAAIISAPSAAVPGGSGMPLLGGRRFRGSFSSGGPTAFGGGNAPVILPYSYLGSRGPRFMRMYSGSSAANAPVRLVAPAAEWAANAASVQSRYGLVDRDRLLLFGSQQFCVVRLDLPFHSETVEVDGTFVGMSGNVACVLRADALTLADTVSGQTAKFSLTPEADAGPLEEVSDVVFANGQIIRGAAGASVGRLQAVVDGPVVYLSTPQGITCVNAQTAEAIFSSPWPKNVTPAPEPAPEPVAAPAIQSGRYLQRSYGPHPPSYLWSGIALNDGQGSGPAYPLVDRVQDGILLATPTPTRVVALEAAGVTPSPAKP